MDDSSLTRMAIEEIVREMHEAKERELLPPMERKVNPLGKPNKRFLGRTINSMLTHNKRENDRKRANCRRKLKELDDKARRRARHDYVSAENKRKSRQKDLKDPSGSESILEVNSSSSSDNSERFRKRRKKKKRQKQKKHKKRSRSLRESRSTSESRSRSRSYDKGDDSGTQVMRRLEETNISVGYSAEDFYAQADINHYTNMAAVAYNQMSLIYSTMFRAATVGCATEITKTAPERRKSSSSISSALSITLSDESMLSNTASLSSLEADENGVLTINVSSDASEGEETKKPKNQELKKYKSTIDSDVEMISSSDNESENTQDRKAEPLSVDSDSNDSSIANSNCSVAIVMCPTDSDDELVEKVSTGPNQNKCVADVTLLQIDLTEE